MYDIVAVITRPGLMLVWGLESMLLWVFRLTNPNTGSGILVQIHDEYTPWVNLTVVTRRPNGTILLCLDPRDLNKAIRRSPCYVRTIADVIPKVSRTSHFSILDAQSGFWQVEPDDESSKLRTLSTPWGKCRWKRLPFRLTCIGEMF